MTATSSPVRAPQFTLTGFFADWVSDKFYAATGNPKSFHPAICTSK